MAHDGDIRTLYIGNLHKNVTDEILYELFLQAGPIERVFVQDTGNPNFHYGFVTYIHKCAVDYAIQLFKGTCLFNKRLLIKRKGEKSNDQPTMSPDISIPENVYNVEQMLNMPMDELQPFTLQKMYQLNDNYNCSKSNNINNNNNNNNNNNATAMQNLHKGHWSDRHRPYKHESRRHHSRPIYNNPRNRQRNNSSSHYNKSYRERKGRY